MIRTMAKLKKTDHTTSIKKDLQILKYPDISTLRFAVFVFRSLHNDEDDTFHFRVNATYSLRNHNRELEIPIMKSTQSRPSYCSKV